MLNYLTYIFQILDDLRNRTLVNDPTDEFQLNERGQDKTCPKEVYLQKIGLLGMLYAMKFYFHKLGEKLFTIIVRQ